MNPSNPIFYQSDLTAVDPRIVPLGGFKGAQVTFVPMLGLPVRLLKLDYGVTNNWIDISGSGGGDNWKISGNNGPGNVLGTLSNDSWDFITQGQSRGGFKNTGENFLKTHANFSGSEFVSLTNALQTTDGDEAEIFSIPVPNNFSGFLTVNIQGRKSTNDEFCAFERKSLFFNDGTSVSLGLIHFAYTDRSYFLYDISLSPASSAVSIKVRGEAAHTVNWSGKLSYQLIGSP